MPNNEKIAEQSGFLTKVAISYNPDSKSFSLNTALRQISVLNGKIGSDVAALSIPAKFLYMRVWNRGTDTNSPEEIAFTPGTAVTLGNTGLQVNFTGTDFVAPGGQAQFLGNCRPPFYTAIGSAVGINNNRCKSPWCTFFLFALSHYQVDKYKWHCPGEIIHDCRNHFRPLTDQECCCTYTVGDGIRSKGDFNSIQEAVDNLPAQGGKVCVLAGIHNAHVLIHRQGRYKS